MRLARPVLAVTVLIALGGCGDSSTSSGASATSPGAATTQTLRGSITVFAATSLKKAFTAEGAAFEQRHPGAHVRFSFAGSQVLVAQVKQGAPADVLATADQATMRASGLTGARTFAHNRLAILTAPGNPRKIVSLQDLARPGIRVVLAGPTVPAGKAAAKALRSAGVTVHPVSLEQDVGGVVTKVRLGEADAGISYVTDLRSAKGAVAGTDLAGVTNFYPVAVAKGGAEAQAFAQFLLSPDGQAVLASFGFLPPA